MNKIAIDYKNIWYPPGGVLIWIIIFLELFTFGAALLLTSGFFMAVSVSELKRGNTIKFKKLLLLTMLFGLLFLSLKSFEYVEKLNEGITVGYNTFFTFYWMLTLFHVIHVLVGLVILTSVYFGIKKENSNTSIEDVEASAAFWHMCDLIWMMLLPVIYLLF